MFKVDGLAGSSPEMIELTLGEMREGSEASKAKVGQALKDGFFYVKMPGSCKEKMSKVSAFAAKIRENEKLKSKKLGDHLGYQERHGSQAVAFVAMSTQWDEVYPREVVEVAAEMNDISIEVLRATLKYLCLPEELWGEATGELTEGRGSHVFTLNHYRPDESAEKIGLNPHKDLGWITVLFIDKLGLETSLDGEEWISIPPKEGYFVINFGYAIELLVGDQNKIRASLHRVRHLAEERISAGAFGCHTPGSTVYAMNAQNELIRQWTYEDYLQLYFAEAEASQKTTA